MFFTPWGSVTIVYLRFVIQVFRFKALLLMGALGTLRDVAMSSGAFVPGSKGPTRC